jgi:hypothetical protein
MLSSARLCLRILIALVAGETSIWYYKVIVGEEPLKYTYAPACKRHSASRRFCVPFLRQEMVFIVICYGEIPMTSLLILYPRATRVRSLDDTMYYLVGGLNLFFYLWARLMMS